MIDSTSPIIGTITMQPRLAMGDERPDDSSLGALLASLAHCPSLAEADEWPRLVACTRLCRFTGPNDVAGEAIRADLARLVEDLESEYERLAVA
jgi:hypothetical protein